MPSYMHMLAFASGRSPEKGETTDTVTAQVPAVGAFTLALLDLTPRPQGTNVDPGAEASAATPSSGILRRASLPPRASSARYTRTHSLGQTHRWVGEPDGASAG